MKNKKRNKLFLLLILILAISIGFAVLSTTLKINGTAGIGKNTWDVHWANVADFQKSEGAVIQENGAAKVDANDNTLVTFNVKLSQPGDYYEFQVDAVNAGTVDAMVQVLPSTAVTGDGTTLPDYLIYTVKYADGEDIEQYQLLAKAEDLTSTPPVYTTERYKVRLEFSTDVDEEDLAEIENKNTYTINLTSPYIQADNNAYDRHASVFEVGEYFRLVPDKATATTNTPGFSGSTSTADQTLWRVININEDGTTEAVADAASSSDITVSGIDGFKYYVAGLQDLASCYAKEGYTVATREMGYDGQTLVLSDTSAFDGTSNQAPSKSSTPALTTGTGEEYMGGVLGDTLYLRDYILVKNTYNGSIDPSPAKYYLLASRFYDYYSSKSFGFHGVCSGCSGNYYIRYESGWGVYSRGYAIRPIITLKAGIQVASGNGSSDNPYILK